MHPILRHWLPVGVSWLDSSPNVSAKRLSKAVSLSCRSCCSSCPEHAICNHDILSYSALSTAIATRQGPSQTREQSCKQCAMQVVENSEVTAKTVQEEFASPRACRGETACAFSAHYQTKGYATDCNVQHSLCRNVAAWYDQPCQIAALLLQKMLCLQTV